jgi:hypothetical protein
MSIADEKRLTTLARAYRHNACGEETVVSGDDYVLLECPFRPVDATYCCGCSQMVPLDAVAWSDSQENIAAYRKRVHASVPFWRGVYLLLIGNAYEGAVNLNLDRTGHPIQHD